MVYITSGLVEALLGFARDREPSSVTIGLTVTPAERLDGDLVGIDPGAPVFSHFYLPDAGNSVQAVFGMDLASPPTQGRFVSHPDGRLAVKRTDDLHEVVFLTVPPWEEVVPFGRTGDRLELDVLSAVPPAERVD